MPRTRAVVTGGAGFLGSHLCQRLLADGMEVICLDSFLTGNPANVEHLLEAGPFRLVNVDVTDYVHIVGDVDFVLHFASPPTPPPHPPPPPPAPRAGPPPLPHHA